MWEGGGLNDVWLLSAIVMHTCAAEGSGLGQGEGGGVQFAAPVVRPKKGQSKTTGTQCIDRCWTSLKQYIPNSLHSKNVDRELNPKIFDYVLSFEFRRNNGPDFWSAWGALAQKAKRTKSVSKNCVRP